MSDKQVGGTFLQHSDRRYRGTGTEKRQPNANRTFVIVLLATAVVMDEF